MKSNLNSTTLLGTPTLGNLRTQSERSVPEGRAKIARRFNAGLEREGTSPEGTAESFPQIPLIEFDAVLAQQRQELLLKTTGAMMLPLIPDIFRNRIQLRDADAERAVFLLPSKEPLIGKRLVNPFGRAAFDQLQRLGDWESRG